MPVYNESERVEAAITHVLGTDVGMDIELIIVDDGSTDGTREILDRMDWPDNVRLILHDRNQGKGAAVRTALAAARGEFAAIFDADLEYEPGDIASLHAAARWTGAPTRSSACAPSTATRATRSCS